MFSYFSSTSPQLTRFEKCVELKQIVELVGKLKNKEKEISSAKNAKGAGSVDFEKHTIIEKLLHDINAKITEFNTLPIRDQHSQELQDIINLAAAIKSLVTHVLQIHYSIINKFRDGKRETAASAVKWGALATTASALYVAPFSLLFKAGLAIGAYDVNAAILDKTGLSDENTKSLILLRDFQSTLDNILRNLRHALNPDLPLNHNERPAAAPPHPLRRANNPGESNSDADDKEESGLLFIFSEPMQDYVDSFANKPKFSDIIADLKLTDEEQKLFEPYLDPILCEIMNIPAMINGEIFDLDSLLKLDVDDDGRRKDPNNRYKFYVRDIQPARGAYNGILAAIKLVQDKRELTAASSTATIESANIQQPELENSSMRRTM